jgi:hypothetical protein
MEEDEEGEQEERKNMRERIIKIHPSVSFPYCHIRDPTHRRTDVRIPDDEDLKRMLFHSSNKIASGCL